MQIQDEISKIRKHFISAISEVKNSEQLNNIKIVYLGRKGKVTRLLRSISSLPTEIIPEAGRSLNLLKKEIEDKIKEAGLKISPQEAEMHLDPTLPGYAFHKGSRHPIKQVLGKIEEIFFSLGFSLVEGPLVEDDWHNFEALNIPEFHPARAMHDTFYIDESSLLLRTHTSPVQIRVMKNNKPPLAVIVPGKCFRKDAIDASHFPVFHQVEGLWVDKDISFAHLKGVLTAFASRMFGNLQTRFRPSFFPFTEPSCEMDIACPLCGGAGCATCGRTGWLEILGAGMVHPKVFENVEYGNGFQGFAFGMGVERIALIYYKLADLRDFYNNDLKFLEQFR